jgi:hypothetical protein
MLSKRQEIYHLIKGSLPSGKGKYPFLPAVRPNFIELKTTKNNNNYEKNQIFTLISSTLINAYICSV